MDGRAYLVIDRRHTTLNSVRFIYKLYYDSNLPWVYGGEYTEFSALVTRVVQAWINVGFEIYFVFDGTRYMKLLVQGSNIQCRPTSRNQVSDCYRPPC